MELMLHELLQSWCTDNARRHIPNQLYNIHYFLLMPCCRCCCRYIVSQPHSISARFITDTLKAAYPAAAAALPDGADAEPSSINSSKVQQELGLRLTPVADTVRDMAAALLQLGIAQPAWAAAAAE